MSPEPDALAHTKLVPVDNDLQLTASTTERNAPTAPFSGPSSDIDLKNTEGFQEAIHEACGMVDKSTSDLNETVPTNKSPCESVAINTKTDADNAFNTNEESKVVVFNESQTPIAIVAEETSAEVPSFMSGWGGASGWGDELDLDLDDVEDVSVEHDDRGSTEGWGIGDMDISSPSSSKSEAAPVDAKSNPGELPPSKYNERNDLPVESKVTKNEADHPKFHASAKSEVSNFGLEKNDVPAASGDNTIEVEWGEASGWDDELDLNLDDDGDKTADGWSIGEINIPSTTSESAPTSATLQPPEGVDTPVCASTETTAVSLSTQEVNVFEGWGLLPSESQSNAIVGTTGSAGAAASKLQISLTDKEDSVKREPRNDIDSQAVSSSVTGTNLCVQSSLAQSSVMPANDRSCTTAIVSESSPSQGSPYPPSAISSPPVSVSENSSSSGRVGHADSSELNDLPESIGDPWGPAPPEITEPPKKSQPISSVPSVTSPNNELSSFSEPGNSVEPWASTPAQVSQTTSNVQSKPQPVGLGIVAKIATSNVYEPQELHRSTHQPADPWAVTPRDGTPTLPSTQLPSQIETVPPQSDSVLSNNSGSQDGHIPVEKTADPWAPGPHKVSQNASSPLLHSQSTTAAEATNSALSSFYDTQNFKTTGQEALDPWAPVATDRNFPDSSVQEAPPPTEVQEPLKNEEYSTNELSNSGNFNLWAPASSDTSSSIAPSDHSGQEEGKPKQLKNILNSLHSDQVDVEGTPPVTEKQDPHSNEQSCLREHSSPGELNPRASTSEVSPDVALKTQSEQGEGVSNHSNDVLDSFYSDQTTPQGALPAPGVQEPPVNELSSPPVHSDFGKMSAWAPSSSDAIHDFAPNTQFEQEEGMSKYSNDVMNSFYSDRANVESVPQAAEVQDSRTHEQSSPHEHNGSGDMNPWTPSSEPTRDFAPSTRSEQGERMPKYSSNIMNSFHSDQMNVAGTSPTTEVQEPPKNEQSSTNEHSNPGDLNPWASTSSEPTRDSAPSTEPAQGEETSKYSNDVMNSFYSDQINVESAPPVPDVQKPLMNEQPNSDEHSGPSDLNPWAPSSLTATHDFAPSIQSEQGEGISEQSNDVMNSFYSNHTPVQGPQPVAEVEESLKNKQSGINEHSNSVDLNSWVPASSEPVHDFAPSTQSEQGEGIPKHSNDVMNSFYSDHINVEGAPAIAGVEEPRNDEQSSPDEQSGSGQLNPWAPVSSEPTHDFPLSTQSVEEEGMSKYSSDVMNSFYSDQINVESAPPVPDVQKPLMNEQPNSEEHSGSGQLNSWVPASSEPTHDFASSTQSLQGEGVSKYSNDVMNSFYSDQTNVKDAPPMIEVEEPPTNAHSGPEKHSGTGHLNPWAPASSGSASVVAPSSKSERMEGTSEYSNVVMNSFYSDHVALQGPSPVAEVQEPLKNEERSTNEHHNAGDSNAWAPASSEPTHNFAPSTQSEQGEGMPKYSSDVMNSFYSGQSTGQGGPPVPAVQEPLKSEEFSTNEHSNSGELNPWALTQKDPASGIAPSAHSGQEAISKYSSNVMNSFYSDQTTIQGPPPTIEVQKPRNNEQSIPHDHSGSSHLDPWAPASSEPVHDFVPSTQSEQGEGIPKHSNDVMNNSYSDHTAVQGLPPVAEVREPLKNEGFSPRERIGSALSNPRASSSPDATSGAVHSTDSRQGESAPKYSNDVVNSFYSDQTPIADPWSVEDSANSMAHPIEHTNPTYSPNTSALHPAHEPESVSYSPMTSAPVDTGDLWSSYSPTKLDSHYDGVPAPVNNPHAQPFAQSFSIMDSTISDERRTPRALMTWGFGGSLVVLTHGKTGSIYEESSKPAKVRIYDMSTIAQDNANEDWTVAVETVAALEPLASNLSTYADMCDRLSTYSMGMDRKSSESISYMWRFLATMCRNPKGNWYPKFSEVLGARLSVPLFNHDTNEQQLQDSPLRFGSPEEVKSQDDKGQAAVQIESLLTRGQSADAVNVARSSGLWPLALIISSSMDQTAFMNAVSVYARESLVNGTALQTLCLSMSQNINELVEVATSAEGVRNWKKTVSILLNQKGSPNAPGREVRVIEKIGDALSHREKDLVAGHLCYLISGKIKALSVDSGEVPLLGVDSTIPSGRPGSMGSLIPILQSVVYEAVFSAQHGQQFPHLLPFRLQIVYELISVGKLELAYQHVQLIISSVRVLLERRSQVSNLLTAPFLSTLESVEVQLKNRLKGTSDSTGGKLMALKQSISSVFKKSTEAILSTSASVASGMNVPVSSEPVQTDHSAPETANPASSSYYEDGAQYDLRQRRMDSFEQSSPDSSKYGAREPTESFSQNYAASQPSPSFSGSTEPRQTSLPPHHVYGHPQSMPIASNNFSVPSNQMNMNMNQTRSSTTATSSTRETVTGNETVESKSESGWNSFVANTIKVLAPAEGDLSPPPVSTGTDTFRNMATSPRSQNSSGLSHMRSASMGDVPSMMASSDPRNLWDPNRRDVDPRRYSVAGFGQSRQFGGIEQSNSSQPQDPSFGEERRSVPGHRRTTSDITHEIQASESRPPRPPRRDNENNEEGREKSRGTGSTWFRRSRFAARLLGAFGAPKQAHMGEENKFVFDKALGRWVIPGEPTPDLDESLAPPPDDDELSNSGFSNFPDSRQQTPDSLHGQLPNPSQDANLNDLSNQTLGPSMYGNAPAGYQHQQSQFPSQAAQSFSPPIGAYTESGTLSGNVSVNDSTSQNGYGDNMSETSVQSAVSAPALRRSMLSDVPPPVAPITNRYRAGRAKLSGRRAYVDTFNPGSQSSIPAGIPAPLRPPSQIMSSSSGAGNMKIFTPAPASTEAASSWHSSVIDETSSVASGNNMQSSGQSNVQSQQQAYSSNNSVESSLPAAAAESEMSPQTSYSTSHRWESSQTPQYRPNRNSAPAPPGPRMSA